MTDNELAKNYNVSRHTIIRYRKLHGIAAKRGRPAQATKLKFK